MGIKSITNQTLTSAPSSSLPFIQTGKAFFLASIKTPIILELFVLLTRMHWIQIFKIYNQYHCLKKVLLKYLQLRFMMFLTILE